MLIFKIATIHNVLTTVIPNQNVTNEYHISTVIDSLNPKRKLPIELLLFVLANGHIVIFSIRVHNVYIIRIVYEYGAS